MSRVKSFLKRVLSESSDDNIDDAAAMIAFYFFLSLFPLILILFALTGLLGGESAFRWVMAGILRSVPPETATYLGQFVREITHQRRPAMLSFGVLLSLWSASSVFAALTDGLNAMFDLRETRPFWKRRLIAIVMLVVGFVLLLGGSAAAIAGPEIAAWIGVPFLGRVLAYPLAFALLTCFMVLVYSVLPNRDAPRVWSGIVVGAVIGSVLWLLATFLFRLYVTHFGSYAKTYGFVGAVIALLMWMYLAAMALLFGAEFAAVIEQDHHASHEPTEHVTRDHATA